MACMREQTTTLFIHKLLRKEYVVWLQPPSILKLVNIRPSYHTNTFQTQCISETKKTCYWVVLTSVWLVSYSGRLCNESCIVRTFEILITWSTFCYSAGSGTLGHDIESITTLLVCFHPNPKTKTPLTVSSSGEVGGQHFSSFPLPPFPSLSFLIPPSHFPPFPYKLASLNPARGSGGAVSSPSGVRGRAPAAKHFFLHILSPEDVSGGND